MLIRCSVRASFFGILFVLACMCRADANGEFCPAQVDSVWTSSGSATTPATSYGFTLLGRSPRSGSATVVIESDHGWFTFTYGPAQFKKATRIFSIQDYKAPYDIYVATVYVHFPLSVLLRHAWVTSATLVGERTYGWNDNQPYSCPIPGLFEQAVDTAAPDEADVAGDANQVNATTDADPPIASTDCKTPFAQAQLLERGRIMYQPYSGALTHGMALVALAINHDSTIREAWVLAQSGNPPFDSAAVASAKRSKVVSAISYCGHADTIELMPYSF